MPLMLYCCWYSIDKHWQRHNGPIDLNDHCTMAQALKKIAIYSINRLLIDGYNLLKGRTNKQKLRQCPFSACPDGYFYGGEIEQSSQRDMVVEKGETSPTYRSFNSWIIRIFLPFPFCCSSYDDYWQLLLGPHLEHCLGKCNSTVRIFQS